MKKSKPQTNKPASQKPASQKPASQKHRFSEVSLGADRRKNQGARRLARRNAQPASRPGQGSRSRGRRGVEVARRSGLVARRPDLHRRDLQERREDDVRKRRGAERSVPPLQFKSRRQRAARDRCSRGRHRKRRRVEGSHSRRGGAEQVKDETLRTCTHKTPAMSVFGAK
jgi:hypothetical protein